MIKIREITSFSMIAYNAAIKLLPQLDPHSELPSEKSFRQILKSEGVHFFTAELDNEIIGIFTVCSYSILSGAKFWIEDVVIDESERGKGHGREMMLYALDFARSKGAKSVELTSRPSRKEANELYRRLGFVIRETNLYSYSFK